MSSPSLSLSPFNAKLPLLSQQTNLYTFQEEVEVDDDDDGVLWSYAKGLLTNKVVILMIQEKNESSTEPQGDNEIRRIYTGKQDTATEEHRER